MKWIYCVIMIVSFQVSASQSVKKKKTIYRIQVTHIDGTISKGIFHSMDDSTFSIARVKKKDTTFQSVQIVEIEKFFVRKNNSIGTGFAIGLLTGTLIGLVTYEEPECDGGCFVVIGPGPQMGTGAAIGGLLGAAVGASLIKSWKLKGSIERFIQLRPRLTKYCFTCN